jgi:hypothetical protein
MCLFLQTQNFQQVTAALVTDMHASSSAANASLSAIRSDLQSQSKALTQSLSALTKLQAVQSEVEAAVQAGLQEVKAVGVMSQGLQQSMDKSLNMTVRPAVGWSDAMTTCEGLVSAKTVCPGYGQGAHMHTCNLG